MGNTILSESQEINFASFVVAYDALISVPIQIMFYVIKIKKYVQKGWVV